MKSFSFVLLAALIVGGCATHPFTLREKGPCKEAALMLERGKTSVDINVLQHYFDECIKSAKSSK